MSLRLELATPEMAAEVAEVRSLAGQELIRRFGPGLWGSQASERGVLFEMTRGRVFVARSRGRIVATLCLATRKPWAIDPAYFTPVKKPIYLTNMAVAPRRQRKGVGQHCLEQALRVVRDWPADAIRLDAFDAMAGAGDFYRKCGYEERGRVVYRKAPLIYFERLVARMPAGS